MTKTQKAIAAGEKPAVVTLDESGDHVDQAILEEEGIAFDPTQMHLDLSKAEKRRTTALMMAIQAYNNIIIKDAEYYMAVSRDSRSGDGPRIQPATMSAMVEAAIQFDAFISGRLGGIASEEPIRDKAEVEQGQR